VKLGTVLPLTLLALSSASLPARADLAQIQARGVLRVLVILDDEREFFSGQTGNAPGFDYEILEGFARANRVRVELVPASGWDALIPNLVQGKGDLIAGRFTRTDSRSKVIDFTTEVFPTRPVVVTRKPYHVVRTLEELRKEKVTVLRGTSMAERLQELGLPAQNLDYSVPTGGIPEALHDGRITCTIHEIHTAIVSQRQDPRLQIGVAIGPPVSLAYGVRKTDGQLLAALNAHLLSVRQTGMWNRLAVKYFGPAALDILHRTRAEALNLTGPR
jgi:ABC-type amino acid transport substrate-binding protein